MLLCREQREIFSIVLTLPFCSSVRCCVFCSLIQWYVRIRLTIYYRYLILLDFRLHRSCVSKGGLNVGAVCVLVFRWFCHVHVPMFCKSVMGVSVLGAEGAGGSVLGWGGWCECKGRETRCQKSWWQNTLIPPLLFLVPQQFSCVECKEPSHPPHWQRADFGEVVKHRFNFRIRITPTDFRGNSSLKNKQIGNGAAEEGQGEKHSAGLKESDSSVWHVSSIWNFNYLSWWTIYPVCFLSLLEVCA